MRRIENINDLLAAAQHQPEAVDLPSDGGGDDIPSRFSLIVESEDPRIGIFAASFAAHLLNNFALSLPGEDDRQILVQVARLIRDYPETQLEIARLTGDLNESVANINSAIQELARTKSAVPPRYR